MKNGINICLLSRKQTTDLLFIMLNIVGCRVVPIYVRCPSIYLLHNHKGDWYLLNGSYSVGFIAVILNTAIIIWRGGCRYTQNDQMHPSICWSASAIRPSRWRKVIHGSCHHLILKYAFFKNLLSNLGTRSSWALIQIDVVSINALAYRVFLESKE